MEIVTYVLDGALEHRDHLGHRGVIGAGDVQVMSAGKGIMHAEANPSSERETHLLQIWILPRNKGNKPRYEQRTLGTESRRGRLLPVVSGGDDDGTLHIDQDATIYVSSLSTGESVTHTSQPGRLAYVFVTAGSATVNGQRVGTGDQARIKDETELRIESAEGAEFMLIDLV
jgi:redox-sensitive bicupin YhaK (pirin superfamily)